MKRILFALLLALPLSAAGVYVFKTLDAKDGLTSSQVNCILKDSRGYVWFGTPAGLYRYDGYVFKSFQSNSQDGSSLPDSYINSIQELKDGSLLIQTSSGYCIYHSQTESFERDMKQFFAKMNISTIPTSIYVDQHKNLWGFIPNKGVVAFNMLQGTDFEFGYTRDAKGIPQGTVCSISECNDGAILVFDDGRLVCCDVMHQQHTVWQTNEIAERKLRKSSTLKAYADQQDNIWLYGQGTLFVYHKKTGVWDTSIGDRLGMTGVNVDNAVNGIVSDRHGNLWIGTEQAGLLKMSAGTQEFESVQPRNINDWRSEETIRIQSLYIDDTGLLWVGTEKSGVAFCGDNIYRFQSTLMGDITAMTQDASGKVWYGTSDKGVIGYEGRLASTKVSALACTDEGSLWVGSKKNGLTRIRDGVATIYSARDSIKTLLDNHINALCKDKVGNLWIATNGGLQVFNPRMNSFSAYTRENGKLTTNTITSIFYSSKGNRLLVGTSEGLMIIDLSTIEIIHLTGNSNNLQTFTNNYITQIYQDSRGLIWLGTREGVNVLDLDNDNLNSITEKQGLCNNNICGISEDKSHNMWLTTSNGVSRVVVQRGHDNNYNFGLYNYNTSDGLQSNEFNSGSILTKSDGNVLLGGLYGVNWTNQSEGETVDALPRVILTQLFIGEEEVQIGHEYNGIVPLTSALNELTKLDLEHSQNTFTIKFAAGNYNQSERLQFMYWMEGLDDDWRNGDALKHGVTFEDLGAGKYTLHVKAISAEGAVSNQERKLEINIALPWYLSWWMLLTYAVVLILIVYIWRFGMKQYSDMWNRKKSVIKELKRQQEEIMSASDDLRQPMARMTSIIGNLSEGERTLEEKEQLNALHSQMLQVITRVSEMQMNLENPEEKATETVKDRMALNSKGEISLPQVLEDELTTEIRPKTTEVATKGYYVALIDDNEEFLQFVSTRLSNFFDIHLFNNTRKAANDLQDGLAHIVVCKEDMDGISGSELCNMLKSNPRTDKAKFVLMTEGVLTPQDMKGKNITLAADDYLAKPFNIQEAIMRFNRLLGLGDIEFDSNLIEGSETRRLESRSSSMTTATESYETGEYIGTATDVAEDAEDEINKVETKIKSQNMPMRQDAGDAQQGANFTMGEDAEEGEEQLLNDYTMNSEMDRQLLKNIEQYVMQNMSRGHISLEEMAGVMGMGRVPFFHKVRNITGKTPAELVRDIRLRHACILLKRTNINMSELATNIGFMTAENFINIFKEKFGVTPLEYRLKYRRG